jgi:LPS export ABC transporter permease LptF/LPS export ABC transporter permease LptG
MLRLDRYIFREVLVPALIALVALSFVLFSRQLGGLLETIIRQAATASEIWAFSAAILPNVLTVTMPMAVLVGILTGFGRMSSDSEAIALRAVGISMRRVLRPVLAFAVLTFSLTLLLTVWVAPRTAARFRALSQQILMKQVSLELTPRVFNEKLQNYVLYVQDVAPGGMEWRGILLADMTNAQEPRVTFAQSGALVRDDATRTFQLKLTNGTTHLVPAIDPNQYSYSNIESTTLRIPMPPAPVPGKPPIAERLTGELWQRMREGSAAYDERVEFHRRFALPFACLALALVGLPLGVSTTRGSKSMGLVLSLILMLGYYLTFIGGTRIAANAQFSPALGAWLPNLIYLILGLVLLSRSDHEYENRGLAWLKQSIEWFTNRIGSVKMGRRQFTNWAYSLTHHSKFLRLLDVYVLRGFWFYFALILVVFVSLFIVVTLFELLPDIVKNKVAASVVFGYFAFLIPQIFYWVAPLTVLLAILINLGTLTKTNEILAVKAGAISLYRMSLPLVLMGMILSAAIYLMQDFVLPYSNQRQDEYRDVIKGNAPQTYRDPQRKWMAGSGSRIYHYTYFDPNLDVFAGFSLFAFEPKTFELREWIFASKARWTGSTWTLEDGWVRRLSATGVDYQQFKSLDLPGMDEPEYFKKEVRTAAQMTYAELREYVANLKQSGFDVTGITVDLNRKLSFPIVSLIMVIIGIPFSFTTGRKGAFYGIGLCVGVGILYWSMFELFDKLGGINRLSPMIAAWFPNLIFGVGGLWLMLRVKT